MITIFKKRLRLKDSTRFLIPVFVIIAVFSIYPLMRGIWMGLTDYEIGSPMKFNGLSNYQELITSRYFFLAFRHIFFILVLALICTYLISLTLSLIINGKVILRKFWRMLLIIPWAVPPVSKIVAWKAIFHPFFGYLNFALKKGGLIKEYVGWTASIDLAIYTLAVVTIWGCVPFVSLSFLAILQSIPKEKYEAAAMDGASAFQMFCYITLPYLTNITVLTTSIVFVWIMNDFPVQYLLTQGGPAGATITPTFLSYMEGFKYGHFGIAGAYSNVMIVLSSIILFIYIRSVFRQQGKTE